MSLLDNAASARGTGSVLFQGSTHRYIMIMVDGIMSSSAYDVLSGKPKKGKPKKMLAVMTARKHRSLSPNRHFVQFHACIMRLRSIAPIIAFFWQMHYRQRAHPSAHIIVLVETAAASQQTADIVNVMDSDFFDDIDNNSIIVTSSSVDFVAMVCDRLHGG